MLNWSWGFPLTYYITEALIKYSKYKITAELSKALLLKKKKTRPGAMLTFSHDTVIHLVSIWTLLNQESENIHNFNYPMQLNAHFDMTGHIPGMSCTQTELNRSVDRSVWERTTILLKYINPTLFLSSSSLKDSSYAKQFNAGNQLSKSLPVEDLITTRLLDIWVHRQVFNMTCRSPTISVFLNDSGRTEDSIQ